MSKTGCLLFLTWCFTASSVLSQNEVDAIRAGVDLPALAAYMGKHKLAEATFTSPVITDPGFSLKKYHLNDRQLLMLTCNAQNVIVSVELVLYPESYSHKLTESHVQLSSFKVQDGKFIVAWEHAPTVPQKE